MAYEEINIGTVANDGTGDDYYTLMQKIKGNFEAISSAPLTSGYAVVDLTSASSDYLLRVGEKAIISYTNTTSRPLRVATVEGNYELTVFSNLDGSTYTAGNLRLTPNSGGLSNGVIDYMRIWGGTNYTSGSSYTSIGGYYDGNSFNYFPIGFQLVIKSVSEISTFTKNKHMQCNIFSKSSASTYDCYYACNVWADTATIWSSLGEITFPFAQSGVICIERKF